LLLSRRIDRRGLLPIFTNTIELGVVVLVGLETRIKSVIVSMKTYTWKVISDGKGTLLAPNLETLSRNESIYAV